MIDHHPGSGAYEARAIWAMRFQGADGLIPSLPVRFGVGNRCPCLGERLRQLAKANVPFDVELVGLGVESERDDLERMPLGPGEGTAEGGLHALPRR